MNRQPENVYNNNTTPKRRRLGVARILRPSQDNQKENKATLRQTCVKTTNSPNLKATPETFESPLPCNQIEYLHNSGNGSIPGSPDVLEDSVTEFENWESLAVSQTALSNLDKATKDTLSDKCKSDQINEAKSAEKLQQCLRENIDTSFDAVNQSICTLNEPEKKSNKSMFLKTRDSFLLEIGESGIIPEPNSIDEPQCNDSFYGLPLKTKALFKTYRNIEKLYEWQEECLNLKAITERRNLIYALPTSGGKTLVAEILMLREVLNRKKNSLFILPFVAIVQEKIWSLSPFAVQLDFLVEEYAAGKGHIPPKKRRKKNSIYIATIEKGLALLRSLIELNRLHEIGLIVVDELHLIGEPGRGGTLEALLATVLFANQGIQIVGMSATIGNLSEVARFLRADVFHRDFRPVELTEYVKLGNMLYRIAWGSDGMEIVPDRELSFDYSAAGANLDPDLLGGLVSEVVPHEACLVFCPTKRNCENVAALLCKLQRREMMCHRQDERQALARALVAEGATELSRTVRCGIAYHHAGLASDERVLLEQAFRSGVISVLCCTSTLAAGVNLPARRVLIRAPHVGRAPLSLAHYRQMSGRAGRAGHAAAGESIMVCSGPEWVSMQAVLRGGLGAACSALPPAAPALLLSAVALGLAAGRAALCRLLGTTLMAIQTDEHGSKVNIEEMCEELVQGLVKAGALENVDSKLVVSTLGKAAIKGCMDLNTAKQFLQDIRSASRGLVLMGSLHLLYLVTPHDGAGVRPDLRHYYSLYCNLDEEGIQTAKVLGITEMNAVRMMTGKPITNVSEKVLCRFYLALMLHDLWKQVPFAVVAEKYCVPRGTVQGVMSSAAALAAGGHKFCEALPLPALWAHGALLAGLATRLQHCAAPDLHHLMELPAVKKARALQLMRAGYKRIEDLAKASVEDLVSSVTHLSRSAATHLVSAARMMLIEKVENLRSEVEDVMEELNA